MKPNQEISLKFWIAMILFFSVVLSIPIMNNLVEKSIISYADIAGLYFVLFLSALLFYIALVLRHSELKKQLSKEAFFSKASAQTITDYDNQIKCQESKINELKTAFEDAVAEITELRSENKALRDDEYELVTYWKERALHQKHTKKVVESKWWECISDEYDRLFFEKGSKYKISELIDTKSSDNLLGLVGNNEVSCLVFKSDFKPVQK